MKSFINRVTELGINAIGFDMDGTLYDEFDFISQAYNTVAAFIAKQYNLKKSEVYKSLCDNWKKFGSSANIFQKTFREFSIEPDVEMVKECINRYRTADFNLIISCEMECLLNDLKSEGYKLFLVTDGNARLQRKKINELGLNRWFDEENIAISGDYGKEYQKPEAYMKDKIKILKSEDKVLYVGDRDIDKMFAENSGFKFMSIESVRGRIYPRHKFYQSVVKRFFDIFLSLISIIVLSPIFIVTAILELIYHGNPIIYTTERPGKDGKHFKMYKFRSMTNETGEDGWLLPEEQRLTKFGKFIRKTSIDELPELFNILKGDMSVIGPRPLLLEYIDYYSDRHQSRHLVRPGLACFRIIPTESKTWTWGEQFENDVWYVKNASLMVDVKMIFAVIQEVFKARDIRTNDDRPPFTGDNLYDIRSRHELDVVVRHESVGRLK